MIEACDLHKSYCVGSKKLHVLKGISLKVRKEEFVSILGPSGAGKSTLLHILGGLDRPTKGRVNFDGIDFYRTNEQKRAQIRNKRIGFVFQFYHLMPGFSALENALLPVLIDKNRRQATLQIKKKAGELLDIVGLSNRLNHKPHQLSGGEQQRTAIVRALMNEPDILFCDEPTGNLDSETGNQILQFLLRLNKEKGLTIILVTHEQDIAKLADKAFHIKDGLFV